MVLFLSMMLTRNIEKPERKKCILNEHPGKKCLFDILDSFQLIFSKDLLNFTGVPRTDRTEVRIDVKEHGSKKREFWSVRSIFKRDLDILVR